MRSKKRNIKNLKSHVICIIYLLRNHINDKVYVGQTWRRLKERFRTYHKSQSHLFNAIQKYGEDSFYYEILMIANTQEIADYWEDYFIIKYNSLDRQFGYNKRRSGQSKGIFTEESLNKMSIKKLGISLPESHKQHISDATRGENNPAVKLTEELVKELYLRALNDPLINAPKLSKIYNISTVQINHILNKNSWKHITQNFPKIDMKQKSRGSGLARSNLTDQIVLDIKIKYNAKTFTINELSKIHNVSYKTIYDIVKNISWKHVSII